MIWCDLIMLASQVSILKDRLLFFSDIRFDIRMLLPVDNYEMGGGELNLATMDQ